jgi:hypothetical protein
MKARLLYRNGMRKPVDVARAAVSDVEELFVRLFFRCGTTSAAVAQCTGRERGGAAV